MENDYLNTHARFVINTLLSSVLRVKPENPIPFMIKWLKEYSKYEENIPESAKAIYNNENEGTNKTNIFIKEKSELEKFKDELQSFKEKEKAQNSKC